MNGDLNFTGVRGRDELILVWPQVAPILIRAIRVYQEHTLEEIFESLIKRERQLWVGIDDDIKSVLVTKIIWHGDEKVCFLELCAGKGLSSIPFLEQIESWAKSAGCQTMRLSGRQGWKRALQDYKVKKITLEKEL